MPFFWSTIAKEGQVFGDPDANSTVTVDLIKDGATVASNSAWIAGRGSVPLQLPVTGEGDYSGLIAALNWAVLNDIHVVNMSIGGLPALIAEGAILVTHENNRAFFERALNTPRTLLTDTLAKNPRKAVVESFTDRKTYSDGTRTVELYHVWPVPHSNGLIVAYLPKEKILFQGDFSLPAAGQPANDHVYALAPVLDKLGIDYERYINVHASAEPQTRADVRAAVEARRAAEKQGR